jgi:hypothetical protein
VLEGLEHSSAEGWLAALINGRAPVNRVQEAFPVYESVSIPIS